MLLRYETESMPCKMFFFVCSCDFRSLVHVCGGNNMFLELLAGELKNRNERKGFDDLLSFLVRAMFFKGSVSMSCKDFSFEPAKRNF